MRTTLNYDDNYSRGTNSEILDQNNDQQLLKKSETLNTLSAKIIEEIYLGYKNCGVLEANVGSLFGHDMLSDDPRKSEKDSDERSLLSHMETLGVIYQKLCKLNVMYEQQIRKISANLN